MSPAPAIATWFVADEPESATFFPQVGQRSDAPEAQAVYWRCAVCFFASSLAVNPAARHLFYTNVALPSVDGIDLAAIFARWGVETVTLPITWRLPRDSVSSWGNQFYVFDVLEHYAASGAAEPLVLLDSDCLWLRDAGALASAIEDHGALTYLLGPDEHAEGSAINGLSREGMARFLASCGGPDLPSIPYFGGEILAVRADMAARLAAHARALWPRVLEQGAEAPREEAHFLSVLYALEGIAPATANAFIRRMWTTFRHNNLAPGDADLAIWHLPAEKRTGFADLFARIAAGDMPQPDQYARLMGYPRRTARKFVRDFCLKLREKLAL